MQEIVCNYFLLLLSDGDNSDFVEHSKIQNPAKPTCAPKCRGGLHNLSLKKVQYSIV